MEARGDKLCFLSCCACVSVRLRAVCSARPGLRLFEREQVLRRVLLRVRYQIFETLHLQQPTDGTVLRTTDTRTNTATLLTAQANSCHPGKANATHTHRREALQSTRSASGSE
jgi:hypothetical protein